jgi:hypothetical protein
LRVEPEGVRREVKSGLLWYKGIQSQLCTRWGC